MSALFPLPAYRARYRAQQTALLLQSLVTHQLLRVVLGMRIVPNDAALAEVRRRYFALLQRDLANVEVGVYPRDLLFQMPIGDYARKLPMLMRDLPRVFSRSRRGDFKDLPSEVSLEDYPPYFRRNFHWQTDGYLSRRSAELYDLGVELLFLGTADIMRRQVIPPMVRFTAEQGLTRPRILDVACGTGRTLSQIARALPNAKLYGLDLSPYYVRQAGECLTSLDDVSLVADNAEAMPFSDGWFDIVTCTYLFHELPRNARRNVLAEIRRVLKPGGLVVLEDSAQQEDSGAVAFFLEQFSAEFHEPFYRDYLEDDLASVAREVGFDSVVSEPCYVAKLVTANKARAPALAV